MDSANGRAETRWLRLLGQPGTRVRMHVNGHRTVSDAAQTGIDGTRFNILDRVWPRQVLYFVFRNRVETIIDGRAGELGPSSFMWLAPGVKHSFAFDPVHHVTLIHIVVTVEHGRREPAPPHRALVLARAEALAAPMRLLHEQLRDGSPYAADAVRAALALVSAVAFGLRLSGDDDGRRLDYEQRRRLDDHLAGRRPHEVHPRDLARELGLSHDYFTRLFHATYGISPRVWLNRERLQRAADDLLQWPRSIAELATAHGYPDLYSFSKQFKKAKGVSPTRYRRRPDLVVGS